MKLKRVVATAVASLAVLFGALGLAGVSAGATTASFTANTTAVVVQTKAELAAHGTTLTASFVKSLWGEQGAVNRAYAVAGAVRSDCSTPATVVYWETLKPGQGNICGWVRTAGDPSFYYRLTAGQLATRIRMEPLGG